MRAKLHAEQLAKRLHAEKEDFDWHMFLHAYEVAEEIYKDTFRKNGAFTIEHVLDIAEELQYTPADTPSYVLALFSKIQHIDSRAFIEQGISAEVTDLLRQYAKLARLKLNIQGKEFSDVVAKMFFTIANSPRVTLVRLADRLINVRTADIFDREMQRHIADKALQLYTPLADLLGLGYIHRELGDEAFKLNDPEAYTHTVILLNKQQEVHETHFSTVQQNLDNVLQEHKINPVIESRIKSVFSCYKKTRKYEQQKEGVLAPLIDQYGMYDVLGIRILVNSIEDCYRVYSLVTDTYHTYSHIKDYIAQPKKNGYQSLHMYLFPSNDSVLELQIRTHDMHYQNEYGNASHFFYKYVKGKQNIVPVTFNWTEAIITWQENVQGKAINEIEYFQRHLYVLTPKHDVLQLPIGSTVLDFAYSIHHEIGNSAIHAYVNNKHVSLDHKLSNGDMVEIMTGKRALPPIKFAKSVVTSAAKRQLLRAVKRT